MPASACRKSIVGIVSAWERGKVCRVSARRDGGGVRCARGFPECGGPGRRCFGGPDQ